MDKSSRTLAPKAATDHRRTKGAGKKKSTVGKTGNARSPEVRYEMLLRYTEGPRKGEVQRLGFKGTTLFSAAVKEAQTFAALLARVGGFDKGAIRLVGVVRAEHFESWFAVNLKRRKDALLTIKKHVRASKKAEQKAKTKKIVKRQPSGDINDLLKTRG